MQSEYIRSMRNESLGGMNMSAHSHENMSVVLHSKIFPQRGQVFSIGRFFFDEKRVLFLPCRIA